VVCRPCSIERKRRAKTTEIIGGRLRKGEFERSFAKAAGENGFEVFLEIRLAEPEKRLVTGIEVLSPSNKRPKTKGWRLYNRKRQAFLAGKAHFVEIDLLRRGRRMPMANSCPESPYYHLVSREQDAPYCKVWPAHFMHPLPTIPIPLAAFPRRVAHGR
jgi:hypothetical protein